MSSESDKIYQALIDSGLSENEIKEKIKTKAEEFKGFISKEGILHLIANECGVKINVEIYKELAEVVNYDDFAIEIFELKESMSNIVLQGRIERKNDIKNFNRKDGSPGIFGSFILNDGGSHVKIILWDQQVDIMKNEYFQCNKLVRIIGGYSKIGLHGNIEVHIGRKGNIILEPQDINPKRYPLLEELNDSTDKDHPIFKITDLHNFTGFIESLFGQVKKIESFKEIDKNDGGKTFLFKFIFSDDTADILVNVWGMVAIECLKSINEGDKFILSKIFTKFNSYTEQNEIVYTKKSTLERI